MDGPSSSVHSGMTDGAPARPSYAVLTAAVSAVLFLLFVYSVAEVLLLFFIASLFSLYLGAVTDFLEHRLRLPRGWGLLLAVLLTLAGMVGVGWLIIPPVFQQTYGLINALPELLTSWKEGLAALAERFPLLGQLLPSPDETVGYVDGFLGNLAGYFADLFPYLFSGLNFLIHLFSVAVMAIYLTLRPSLYRDGLIVLFPPLHRDLVRSILTDLTVTLRAWMVGQILAMIVLGTLTWIGLELLNVSYSIAFGVFTGLLVVIPFFGTLVSTLLPALFVLGAGSSLQALLVVLLGVLVHLFEANFVHPLIMERQINLPPVLTILAVLIMAELMGAIGLLVAVPVLATVMVIIRKVYIHRVLEGRGFRRALRDAPVAIPLPDGLAFVHPEAAGLSIPAMMENRGGARLNPSGRTSSPPAP
ncbi:MAG: AI-2E family transporter [Gemmatimonadota bacterium]|nr:AI-2E family transporter [Gemmatimonadota bacterium]